MASNAKPGTFVWGKMKGFAPWPAKIADMGTGDQKKKNQIKVYFFGTHNYGWLPESSVYAYKKNFKEFTAKTVKSSGFKEALEEISEEYEQYVKDAGGEPDEFVEPESAADTSAKAPAVKRSSPAAARRASNQSNSLFDDSAAIADTEYVPGETQAPRSSAGTSRQPPKKRRINASTAASTSRDDDGEDPFEFGEEEHTSPKRSVRERNASDDDPDFELLANGSAEAAPAPTTTAPARRGRGARGRGSGRAAAAAAAAAAPSDDRRSTSPTAASNARSPAPVASGVKRSAPGTSSLAAAMAKSQSATQSQSTQGVGRSRLSPTASFLMSASAQSGVAPKTKRDAAAAGALADIRTTQSGTIMIDDYLAANQPLAFIFDNTNALSLAILARLATQLGGSHPILAYPCKPVASHKSASAPAASTSNSASNATHSKSEGGKDALLNGEVAAAGDSEKKDKDKDKEKKESDKEVKPDCEESATPMDTEASASAAAPAATQDIDTSKQSSQQDSFATAPSTARSTSAAVTSSGSPSLAEAIGSPDLVDFFRAHNVDAVADLGHLFQKSELIFVSCPDASFLESFLFSRQSDEYFKHLSERALFVEIGCTLEPDIITEFNRRIQQLGFHLIEVTVVENWLSALPVSDASAAAGPGTEAVACRVSQDQLTLWEKRVQESVALVAGDPPVVQQFLTNTQQFFKSCVYVGPEVGHAQRMKLVFSSLQCSMLAALAESLALSLKMQLNPLDFLQILEASPVMCPLLQAKAYAMLNGNYTACHRLGAMQSEARTLQQLADRVSMPTPFLSSLSESLKRASARNYSEDDVCALFKALARP